MRRPLPLASQQRCRRSSSASLWLRVAAACCWLLMARNAATVVRGDCISRKYEAFPEHVGCLAASPAAAQPRGIDLGDRNVIVTQLAAARARVTASDMQAPKWDLELASLAQRWAENCNVTRDENLSVPGRFASVGQIVVTGLPNWWAAIIYWVGNQQSFTYDNPSVMNYLSAVDYAQLVWASASIVGCGFSTCNGIGKFYVCNFAPGYPTPSNYAVPYTNGTRCGSCPGSCYGDFCDCGSVVCQNGGMLSLSSCTCTCAYPHHTGPSCGLSCSGIADPAACSSKKASDCKTSPAVTLQCPNLCQLCPYAAADYRPPAQGISIATGKSSNSAPAAEQRQIDGAAATLGLYALAAWLAAAMAE